MRGLDGEEAARELTPEKRCFSRFTILQYSMKYTVELGGGFTKYLTIYHKII